MRPRGPSRTESEAGVILPEQDVFLHHVVAPCASACRLTPPPSSLFPVTRWMAPGGKKKKKKVAAHVRSVRHYRVLFVCVRVWCDKAGKWIPSPEPIKAGAQQADK